MFSAFYVHGGAPGTLGSRWEKWKARFENVLLAMDIKDNARKRAMLLHYAGEQVYDIFVTLPDKGEAKDFDKAITALATYFSPKTNIDFEVYMFRQST